MSKDTTRLLQSELADELGIRPSTIKYYTQLALLPYQQEVAGGHRRYNLKEARERIELINELKGKGLNMNKIVEDLGKHKKLYGKPVLYALNLNNKAEVESG